MEPMLPDLVAAATDRARSAGFRMSCNPAVGGLLAVLAAHLPSGSRVLELGTGTAAMGARASATWGSRVKDMTVLLADELCARAEWSARGGVCPVDGLGGCQARGCGGQGVRTVLPASRPATASSW